MGYGDELSNRKEKAAPRTHCGSHHPGLSATEILFLWGLFGELCIIHLSQDNKGRRHGVLMY